MRIETSREGRIVGKTFTFLTFNPVKGRREIIDSCQKFFFYDMVSVARRCGLAWLQEGREIRKCGSVLRFLWDGKEVTQSKFKAMVSV